MAEKEYHINHYKVRDACSIMWVSDEYNINQLEPYISSIGCDDGEDYHYLISSEWPEAKGKDDFKTLELNDFEDDVIEQIEIEAKYAGYLDRQRMDIKDFEKEENLLIPKTTNYKLVGSLSNEIVEKLSKIKPPTLGAASRISGVTPAATIALLRYIKKNKNKKAA